LLAECCAQIAAESGLSVVSAHRSRPFACPGHTAFPGPTQEIPASGQQR
jgi:hypothetical protein